MSTKHFCTVSTDLIKDGKGTPHYVHCCKEATHAVEGSDWFVCEEHAEYANYKGWKLTKLK